MRILIATTQVPFIRGGAELHAEGLCDAFRADGHKAEIATIPFKWYPPEAILDHMLACRLLDLTEVAGTPVDLLVGLKFPAYLIQHPRKIVWLLHQHRTAYDLWDHPLGDLIYAHNGQEIREAIRQSDTKILGNARKIYANSANVARRLKQFCGVDSSPLYHPPPAADKFFKADAEDYFFFPSRICPSKRQSLVIEALEQTTLPVIVKFAGAADTPGFEEKLKTLARNLKVDDRIFWLGEISEEEKRETYAKSLAVIYPPIDEDYGYVTLEAMLASKPVITCTDSGGPLEFVQDGESGLITEPTVHGLALAMDRIWRERALSEEWGNVGRHHYEAMSLNWPTVVRKLLS